MSTIAHRQPTIRFPRLHKFQVGSQVLIYWNGSRAANGDGVAGGVAPVNYAAALAGPLDVWPNGQRSIFGGRFGRGGFGVDGGDGNAGGFGTGPFAIGEFCSPGGWFEWAFPFVLRDGDYAVGVRMCDGLGNVTTSPTVELTFTVAAIPRPATRARIVSWDDGGNVLNIAWQHSPDFEAA